MERAVRWHPDAFILQTGEIQMKKIKNSSADLVRTAKCTKCSSNSNVEFRPVDKQLSIKERVQEQEC